MVATVIRSMLNSVAHLHQNNVIHRDIHPRAFLFKSRKSIKDVVLTNFESAVVLGK